MKRSHGFMKSVHALFRVGIALWLALIVVVVPISPVFAEAGEAENIEALPVDDGLANTEVPQENSEEEEESPVALLEYDQLDVVLVESETADLPSMVTTEDTGGYLARAEGESEDGIVVVGSSLDPTAPSTIGAFSAQNDTLASDMTPTSDMAASTLDTSNMPVNSEESHSNITVSTVSTDGVTAVGESSTQGSVTQEADALISNDKTESPSAAEALVSENIEAPNNIEPLVEENEESIDDVPTQDSVDIDELRRQIREELRGELRQEIELELRKDCTALEDGSYYCMKHGAKAEQHSFEDETQIFSAPDGQEGDEEIYLREGDAVVRLTDNVAEDRFPSLDHAGKRAVWQTLIDGRWQIMFRDIEAMSTVQVTAGDTNNMNPFIYQDTIVWQTWADGNWEIMIAKKQEGMVNLADADIALSADTASSTVANTNPGLSHIADEWSLRRITTNSWHDMFPRLAAGLITWQAHQNGMWQVYMYDLATEDISLLSEGGDAHENPRFAVVWEKRSEDGTVEVIGYDFSTREVKDLAKRKPEMPEKIPEPPVDTNVPVPVSTASAAANPALLKDGDPPSN